jgi:hypothetical protein
MARLVPVEKPPTASKAEIAGANDHFIRRYKQPLR